MYDAGDNSIMKCKALQIEINFPLAFNNFRKIYMTINSRSIL